MSTRRFVVKVNADACPDGIGQPAVAADWEGKRFKTGVPQKTREGKDLPPEETRHPEPGDHVLIWVNDGESKGTGLTAIGEVSDFVLVDPAETAIRNIALFAAPRLDGEDLGAADRPVLDDLRRSRLVTLRYVDHEKWDAIRGEAAAKAARAAGGGPQLTAVEGKRAAAASRRLERDARFRTAVLERNRRVHGGTYRCEGCAFSADNPSLFDAHHLVPLALGQRETGELDFAVLCPTCHRVAHRLGAVPHEPLTVAEIRAWRQAREGGRPS